VVTRSCLTKPLHCMHKHVIQGSVLSIDFFHLWYDFSCKNFKSLETKAFYRWNFLPKKSQTEKTENRMNEFMAGLISALPTLHSLGSLVGFLLTSVGLFCVILGFAALMAAITYLLFQCYNWAEKHWHKKPTKRTRQSAARS
jgi:hypothetical protein